MSFIYEFLKALLDPVVFVLLVGAAGIIYSLRKKKPGWGKLLLGSSFLALYLASISPVSERVSYLVEKDYLLTSGAPIGQAEIIVVLGGGVTENKRLKEPLPSIQTASRLLYAVQAFQKSGANYLVCCGMGTGRLSEAEVMGNAAERLGVLREKIILDPKSRNTREHAEGLNLRFTDKQMRIGLVTSAYHMKRAEREIRKYFRNVEPLPSDYLYSSRPLSVFSFLPHSSRLNTFATAFREMIGNIWYRMTK